MNLIERLNRYKVETLLTLTGLALLSSANFSNIDACIEKSWKRPDYSKIIRETIAEMNKRNQRIKKESVETVPINKEGKIMPPTFEIFVYNHFKDYDNNGQLNLVPDEAKGLNKKSYSENENIAFGYLAVNLKGHELKIQVIDSEGNILTELGKDIDSNLVYSPPNFNPFIMMLGKKLGAGKYTYIGYLDGKETYKQKFEIVK